MNLTNNSGEYKNEKNPTSDDDDDDDGLDRTDPPSILIENFLTDNENEQFDSSEEEDDDDDDDGSDIENHYSSKNPLPTEDRLGSLLRQSNRLVELKLNTSHNRLINNPHQSLRHALSDSDMSKRSQTRPSILHSSLSSNNFYLSTNRSHRLYLPSTCIYDLQNQITNWLQASTYLIDSISTSIYHRRCWSQLLLTYFIECGYINLEFNRCTHSASTTSLDQDSCSVHMHGCVPEEDAFKLCSILQKGSRFNINSIVFDHIRRIIVIKSMQEVFSDNTNLQQIYVKQLKSLKQSLTHQQSSVTNINNNSIINIASIYSKLLLFLSSLYSIKAETMQALFCQHLLHNPSYSYLITS
ncbi:unnamed protein product [Adineta ricciae]|uniref:Uncharacterized protein n=1 Tax=Adineta ricciae TaxID=249248 RepID=A0A815T4F2_ADIRI|nr:unnamed protein product [Adineta ricciae]